MTLLTTAASRTAGLHCGPTSAVQQVVDNQRDVNEDLVGS